MDEQTKTLFKWKFYRLTVELNVIVLLVAASILIFFIVHSSYAVPLIGGMLVLALLIGVDFFRKYHETKAWLDVNAVKENESDKSPHNNI
jgi:hypothetical protein